MSKIEDALKKARKQGNGLVRFPRSSNALQLVSDTDGVQRSMEKYIPDGTKDIAGMKEPIELSKKELDNKRIIFSDMIDTKVVNAFREARTKILHLIGNRNSVIMVSSVTRNGGSSFTSLNLAASFCFDQSKTSILIDCNLKNPAYDQLLDKKSNSSGLLDYLASDSVEVEDILQPTGVRRLRVITAGKKKGTSSEYFTSTKMRNFLDNLRSRYRDRYIVIDAPPVSDSADAQILADLCDYVILVVPYGVVTESCIQSAKKAIGEKKIIGVIFNNQPKMPAGKKE